MIKPTGNRRRDILPRWTAVRSIVILATTLLVLPGCGRSPESTQSNQPPERIIALAPNITDTLIDLGLSNRLVGASRFTHVEQALDIPVIGDFMNINYEKIVTLKPDLVILERSSDAVKARLESLGIPYIETCSLSIADIFDSIQHIGETCGIDQRAAELIEQFNRQLNTLKNTPAHRPRTLLTFSDFSNATKIEQVYAFGANCIHSELLRIAGGDNVVVDARPSVILSQEAVIRMNPELIIELSAGGPTNQWANLPSVDAVRHHRIHILDGTYTTIPSPSCLIQTLEDFSRIVRREKSTE